MSDAPKRPTEFSAGGVVVRGDEVVVIIPTRRAANGAKVLALPKGHVDPGETPIEAAEREIREEAGVDATPNGDALGAVNYWYMRKGKRIAKQVDFWLFDYVGGDVADHDHEVERAEWIPLSEAAKRLTYDGEREMVARALSRISSDG